MGKQAQNLRSDAVVLIEHARHAIEPESIKTVLVHPEPQVAQQEPQDLMVAVVEEPAVPELMLAFGALVEVLMISTVELIQTIKHVLGRMAVHDIKQHNEAQAVRHIDQLLEILGLTVPAAGGEEVVDLVAKAGVVGMLHDGHELNGIVAQSLDAREHVLGELLVRGNAQLGRRNADVGLVDAQAAGLLGPRMLERVPVCRGRVPEPGVVGGRDGDLLRDVLDPGWYPVDPFCCGEFEGDLYTVRTR